MNIIYNINGGSGNVGAMLIAALYQGNMLNKVETKNLSEGNIISLDIPDNHENYSVKLMVWDGYDTLRPIGSPKEVIDLDNYSREKYLFISSELGATFNIYMDATTVKGANNHSVHTIIYDPEKLLPVDLCGFTYDKELEEKEIENTNIVIQNADLSNGRIEYKFDIEQGRNTGVNNYIKFRAIEELDNESIFYTIQ